MEEYLASWAAYLTLGLPPSDKIIGVRQQSVIDTFDDAAPRDLKAIKELF
jgi:hypothetical protein